MDNKINKISRNRKLPQVYLAKVPSSLGGVVPSLKDSLEKRTNLLGFLM